MDARAGWIAAVVAGAVLLVGCSAGPAPSDAARDADDVASPPSCPGVQPLNNGDCPPGNCNTCRWLDRNPTPGCPAAFCYPSPTLTGAQCMPTPCSSDDAGATD